jgi:hypothetical protein
MRFLPKPGCEAEAKMGQFVAAFQTICRSLAQKVEILAFV